MNATKKFAAAIILLMAASIFTIPALARMLKIKILLKMIKK